MPTDSPAPRILRLPQVTAKCGLQRDSVYRLAKLGKFPAPVKLSERASGWIEAEIDAWIAQRVAERAA